MIEQSRKSARNEQKQQNQQLDTGDRRRPASVEKLVEKKIDNSLQGRWTKLEHKKFVEALSLFGKNWRKVEEHVASRSGAQIRSHAQKFFNRLEREFNQQFNGLKSSEIKLKFENKALHNLSFGVCSDVQRRPRSDSVNTNLSLDLLSDEDQVVMEVPVKSNNSLLKQLEILQSQQQMTNQMDQSEINLMSQYPVFNDIVIQKQQKAQQIESIQNVDLSNQNSQVLQEQINLYQQSFNLNRIYQIISAYQYVKENQPEISQNENDQRDQESLSYQEKSSLQELPLKLPQEDIIIGDLLPMAPLRKKYSVARIGQDESFLHFIIDKYYTYFNQQLPTLGELADTSQKKVGKAISLEVEQKRSRRGSFVFCNEDEEENETKYQQLKKLKVIHQEIIVNKKSTN